MATESDNVNSGALGTLVAVGTVAFAGIALVVTALVRAEMAQELAVKEVSADRAYRDLVAEQTAKLNAPAAYVDRGRGVVSLPLDRAMELTVAGLSKDPNSATPPPAAGGTGGSAAATDAGGTGGGGGTSGGGAGGGGAATSPEGADKKDGAEPKPSEDLKKEDAKKEGAKKEPKPAPKAAPGAPGSPAAPAPVAPNPAPAAPSPAPNGQ
jgi:peptidoglycan DL-endopeptidase CwlO